MLNDDFLLLVFLLMGAGCGICSAWTSWLSFKSSSSSSSLSPTTSIKDSVSSPSSLDCRSSHCFLRLAKSIWMPFAASFACCFSSCLLIFRSLRWISRLTSSSGDKGSPEHDWGWALCAGLPGPFLVWSSFRHLARRFWNHTWKNTHKRSKKANVSWIQTGSLHARVLLLLCFAGCERGPPHQNYTQVHFSLIHSPLFYNSIHLENDSFFPSLQLHLLAVFCHCTVSTYTFINTCTTPYFKIQSTAIYQAKPPCVQMYMHWRLNSCQIRLVREHTTKICPCNFPNSITTPMPACRSIKTGQ